MGLRKTTRLNVSVTAGVNLLSSSLVMPGVGYKIVVNVVPTLAGIFSIVRIDGVEQRVAQMFDGVALDADELNDDEAGAPKYYSYVENEVRVNFRYSVTTTFKYLCIYAEKNHAPVFHA